MRVVLLTAESLVALESLMSTTGNYGASAWYSARMSGDFHGGSVAGLYRANSCSVNMQMVAVYYPALNPVGPQMGASTPVPQDPHTLNTPTLPNTPQHPNTLNTTQQPPKPQHPSTPSTPPNTPQPPFNTPNTFLTPPTPLDTLCLSVAASLLAPELRRTSRTC